MSFECERDGCSVRIARAERQIVLRLDAEFSATPVTTLRVVPDGVACPQADPLRDRAVLLLLLSENLLDLKRLVRRHDS